MKRLLSMIFVAVCVVGCNSTQLRTDTLRLTTTVPDIQQVQVLDNLARLSADPGVMPYYTIITNGTANITDKGKISGFLSSSSALFPPLRRRRQG